MALARLTLAAGDHFRHPSRNLAAAHDTFGA